MCCRAEQHCITEGQSVSRCSEWASPSHAAQRRCCQQPNSVTLWQRNVTTGTPLQHSLPHPTYHTDTLANCNVLDTTAVFDSIIHRSQFVLPHPPVSIEGKMSESNRKMLKNWNCRSWHNVHPLSLGSCRFVCFFKNHKKIKVFIICLFIHLFIRPGVAEAT